MASSTIATGASGTAVVNLHNCTPPVHDPQLFRPTFKLAQFQYDDVLRLVANALGPHPVQQWGPAARLYDGKSDGFSQPVGTFIADEMGVGKTPQMMSTVCIMTSLFHQYAIRTKSIHPFHTAKGLPVSTQITSVKNSMNGPMTLTSLPKWLSATEWAKEEAIAAASNSPYLPIRKTPKVLCKNRQSSNLWWLIVVPTCVVDAWKTVMEMMCPEMAERLHIVRSKLNDPTPAPYVSDIILLTTHTVYKQAILETKRTSWLLGDRLIKWHVVFDEAQFGKNHDGSAKGIQIMNAILYLKRACTWPMTGTPEENKPSDWGPNFRLVYQNLPDDECPFKEPRFWSDTTPAGLLKHSECVKRFVKRRVKDELKGTMLEIPPLIDEPRPEDELHMSPRQLAIQLRYLQSTKYQFGNAKTEARSSASGSYNGGGGDGGEDDEEGGAAKISDLAIFHLMQYNILASVSPDLVSQTPPTWSNMQTKKQKSKKTTKKPKSKSPLAVSESLATEQSDSKSSSSSSSLASASATRGSENEEDEALEGSDDWESKHAYPLTMDACKLVHMIQNIRSLVLVKPNSSSSSSSPLPSSSPCSSSPTDIPPLESVSSSSSSSTMLQSKLLIDDKKTKKKSSSKKTLASSSLSSSPTTTTPFVPQCQPMLIISHSVQALKLAKRVIQYWFARHVIKDETEKKYCDNSIDGVDGDGQRPVNHEAFQLPVPIYHGGLGEKERRTIVTQFQEGRHPVLLMSLFAGGVGINLTAGCTVYFLSYQWNPSKEEQGIARVWRPGQKKNVRVIRPWVKDIESVESLVIGRQREKLLSVENTLGTVRYKPHKKQCISHTRKWYELIFKKRGAAIQPSFEVPSSSSSSSSSSSLASASNGNGMGRAITGHRNNPPNGGSSNGNSSSTNSKRKAQADVIVVRDDDDDIGDDYHTNRDDNKKIDNDDDTDDVHVVHVENGKRLKIPPMKAIVPTRVLAKKPILPVRIPTADGDLFDPEEDYHHGGGNRIGFAMMETKKKASSSSSYTAPLRPPPPSSMRPTLPMRLPQPPAPRSIPLPSQPPAPPRRTKSTTQLAAEYGMIDDDDVFDLLTDDERAQKIDRALSKQNAPSTTLATVGGASSTVMTPRPLPSQSSLQHLPPRSTMLSKPPPHAFKPILMSPSPSSSSSSSSSSASASLAARRSFVPLSSSFHDDNDFL